MNIFRYTSKASPQQTIDATLQRRITDARKENGHCAGAAKLLKRSYFGEQGKFKSTKDTELSITPRKSKVLQSWISSGYNVSKGSNPIEGQTAASKSWSVGLGRTSKLMVLGSAVGLIATSAGLIKGTAALIVVGGIAINPAIGITLAVTIALTAYLAKVYFVSKHNQHLFDTLASKLLQDNLEDLETDGISRVIEKTNAELEDRTGKHNMTLADVQHLYIDARAAKLSTDDLSEILEASYSNTRMKFFYPRRLYLRKDANHELMTNGEMKGMMNRNNIAATHFYMGDSKREFAHTTASGLKGWSSTMIQDTFFSRTFEQNDMVRRFVYNGDTREKGLIGGEVVPAAFGTEVSAVGSQLPNPPIPSVWGHDQGS